MQRAENQVASKRGLRGVFRCFQISNFTDQHNIRIVSEDTSQTCCKGQSDLGMHLNLVDTLELILDRILGGDDLRVFTLDFIQRAVECRCLSSTRRPRHQQDAVRKSDKFPEGLVNIGGHADVP